MTRIQAFNKIIEAGKAMALIKPSKTGTIDERILEVINALSEANRSEDAIKYLLAACKVGEFEQIGGNLFTKDNYFIKNLFKRDGMLYDATLKKLGSLKLDITPKHIKTISKDSDAFIVGKYNCTDGSKIGLLYEHIKEVPKEQKITAYKDIQKMVKKGFISDDILRNPEAWKVSLTDKKILLGSDITIRPIEKGENKTIIERVHNIIFDQ